MMFNIFGNAITSKAGSSRKPNEKTVQILSKRDKVESLSKNHEHFRNKSLNALARDMKTLM